MADRHAINQAAINQGAGTVLVLATTLWTADATWAQPDPGFVFGTDATITSTGADWTPPDADQEHNSAKLDSSEVAGTATLVITGDTELSLSTDWSAGSSVGSGLESTLQIDTDVSWSASAIRTPSTWQAAAGEALTLWSAGEQSSPLVIQGTHVKSAGVFTMSAPESALTADADAQLVGEWKSTVVPVAEVYLAPSYQPNGSSDWEHEDFPVWSGGVPALTIPDNLIDQWSGDWLIRASAEINGVYGSTLIGVTHIHGASASWHVQDTGVWDGRRMALGSIQDTIGVTTTDFLATANKNDAAASWTAPPGFWWVDQKGLNMNFACTPSWATMNAGVFDGDGKFIGEGFWPMTSVWTKPDIPRRRTTRSNFGNVGALTHVFQGTKQLQATLDDEAALTSNLLAPAVLRIAASPTWRQFAVDAENRVFELPGSAPRYFEVDR